MGFNLQLQPKQWLLDDIIENSHASWCGYGGSRGGGKSAAARRIMLRRRIEHPGTAGQIIRRVWEDCRVNHVERFFEEFPDLLPFYRVQDHELTIPTTGRPSRILFSSAETEGDVKRKAFGPEYMDVFVDQAEQFSEAELKLLKTTCRWPNTPEHRCKFALFFNPGGKGAAFLRRVFHAHEFHENENGDDFQFVQAFGWDNAQWCMAALTQDGLTQEDFYSWDDKQRFEYFITRRQYGKELNALPHVMRIAHLLGTFDKFAGQFFDIFDVNKHVGNCHPIPEYTKRWLGIDWGRAHGTACYWNAKQDGLTKTYREYYEKGRTPASAAEEIVAATPPSERKHIDAIFLSHDAFAEKTDPNTVALQMGEVFRRHGMPEPTRAPKNPVGGAALIYEMFRTRTVLIDPSCEKLIDCIPVITRDEAKPESTLKVDGDDPYEAFKYGLQGRYGNYEGRQPQEERIQQQIQEMGFVDPDAAKPPNFTMINVWSRKLQASEGRRSQPTRFAGRAISRRKKWRP